MPESLTLEDAAKCKKMLLHYIKEKAVSKGNITLSSGKTSDLYVDAKMVTLDPEGAFLTAITLFDALKDTDFDAVGGMTMGADPIVGAFAVISYQLEKPSRTFIIRKEPKKHGKQKWIEGPLGNYAKIVIIDDVTTTGKSILDSINIIERYTDCEIVKIISLVDRMEGAREALRKEGYDLYSIFNRSDLLNDEKEFKNDGSFKEITITN